MSTQLDDLLGHLGTGSWNLLHFLAIGYCTCLPVPHALAGAFISPRVPYTCRRPSYASEPPPGNNETSECSYFVVDPTTGDLEEEPCSEWDFDNSTFASTLTDEYHLVCERDYLRATYQSMYMFGVFMGAPFNGFLADRYGRKRTYTTASIMFTVIAISSSWITNFSALLAARFLLGTTHSALLKTGYILAMEVCAPKVRSLVGIAVFLPWGLATVLWGGIAYLLNEWRWLQLALSLPCLLLMPFLWYMDESPRWLAVRGQHQRALEVLKKAARWNKVELPPNEKILSILKSGGHEAKDSQPQGHQSLITKVKSFLLSLLILFRTPRLRAITLASYFDYLVVAMVYFGLNLSGSNLTSNVFLYMSLMGLMEIPAYTLMAPVVVKIGRRASVWLNFVFTGLVLLVLPFVPKDFQWISVTLAMIGKMAISSAFQAFNLYCSELFPTEVRTRGVSTAFMMSRIGSMASPFITDFLGSMYPWSPSVVFGGASVAAGLVTMTLPETLNIALPNTITHLEERKDSPKTRGFLRLPTKEPVRTSHGEELKQDLELEGRALTSSTDLKN